MFIKLSQQSLYSLYIDKKTSMRNIAKVYGCSKTTVGKYLRKYGIPTRTRTEVSKLLLPHYKYNLSGKYLRNLYIVQKLSAYEIARIIGCNSNVIFHRLKKYGIERRSLSEAVTLTNPIRLPKIASANIKYFRKDFSGDLLEKAYLIGFRLGDLHVSKRPYGLTILIQGWSTVLEQNILISDLFKSYGHLTFQQRIKHNKLDLGITCLLNTTFDFLLGNSDSIPKWILETDAHFFAFLSGYIDAEGNFNVDHGFARLSVSSYQKNILKKIHKKLNQYRISCPPPYISVKAGYVDKRGIRTNKDLWTLRVNKQESILKLYTKIFL